MTGLMQECIFCKIANKQIPSEIVFEDDNVVVFHDINPQAPVHLLIVPKQHIESIKSDGSEEIAKQLIKAAKQIAKERDISGYKLVFNVGSKGGQTINHLHLHLLSGKVIALP